ncbi:MAG: superoxide dismutase family protein [Bacteroidota bacterium]|nr:superoxide dismutase family protein [Bacteroidota bacterium]
MKKLIQSNWLTICILCSLSLIACNNGSSANTETKSDSSSAAMETKNTMTADPMKEHAVADVTGVFPDTTVTGTVQFDAQPGGKVKMKLDLSIPKKANKLVAVHIHEKGDCADMGKAAGGHWNPTNAQHGKWGSSSFHSGDIGNVTLDANGKGSMEMETDLWSLGGDAKTNILGKSIIVHGGVDDFTSQPSGNAGTRIGCGIIK